MNRLISDNFSKIKNGGSKMTMEVRQRTAGYILAGLGFVAGLAWNDAIKSLIEYVFPLDKNNLAVKFLYAGIATLLIVTVARWLTKEPETKEDNTRLI